MSSSPIALSAASPASITAAGIARRHWRPQQVPRKLHHPHRHRGRRRLPRASARTTSSGRPHMAHDCLLGDHISSAITSCSPVMCRVEDWVVISGGPPPSFRDLRQAFLRRRLSASAGDVPPFMVVDGHPFGRARRQSHRPQRRGTPMPSSNPQDRLENAPPTPPHSSPRPWSIETISRPARYPGRAGLHAGLHGRQVRPAWPAFGRNPPRLRKTRKRPRYGQLSKRTNEK